MYVVEFDVESASQMTAFDAAKDHLTRWLGRGLYDPLDPAQFSTAGSMELPSVRFKAANVPARNVEWEVVDVGSVKALRLSLGQEVGKAVRLTTRVTVAADDTLTTLRVGLSREYHGGALTPVGDTDIYQPGVVGEAARDPTLKLRVGAQLLDTRFLPVRSEVDAQALVDAIRSARRLPLLLVHVRSPESWDVARTAAAKLVGLVRVITLNYATSKALRMALPEVSVPFAGAALVWSDISAPIYTFSDKELADLEGEGVRSRVMSRVAPLSALARGLDEPWRRARVVAQRGALDLANRRVLEAQNASDAGAEIEALQAKNEEIERQLRDAEQLAQNYAEEAASLESRATAADIAEEQSRYWMDLYQSTQAASPPTVDDPWSAVPQLESGSDPSATFLALEDAAEARIVFTDGASRSWQKVSYPDPADMSDKLHRLARAAWKLYGPDSGVGGKLTDWFKVEFEINVAMSDETIDKNKSLKFFNFEGKQRDQTPHVKVRDGVKQNEVGRIHFAFDSDAKRLIINHVALKLYGI